MNRPRPNEKVRNDNFSIDTLNYMEDLEEYCDKLVNKLDMLGIEINPCKGCQDYCYKSFECKSNGGCGNKEIDDEIKRLKKALDKACNILNQDLYCQDCRYKYSNPSICDNCGDGQIGEEKWKEWLMKNG